MFLAIRRFCMASIVREAKKEVITDLFNIATVATALKQADRIAYLDQETQKYADNISIKLAQIAEDNEIDRVELWENKYFNFDLAFNQAMSGVFPKREIFIPSHLTPKMLMQFMNEVYTRMLAYAQKCIPDDSYEESKMEEIREFLYSKYNLADQPSPANFIIADALKVYIKEDPSFKDQFYKAEQEFQDAMSQIKKK